ncbi:hypothetical protein GUITHDRAFT_148844, partial [Guillardia theta CCMP2712]
MPLPLDPDHIHLRHRHGRGGLQHLDVHGDPLPLHGGDADVLHPHRVRVADELQVRQPHHGARRLCQDHKAVLGRPHLVVHEAQVPGKPLHHRQHVLDHCAVVRLDARQHAVDRQDRARHTGVSMRVGGKSGFKYISGHGTQKTE